MNPPERFIEIASIDGLDETSAAKFKAIDIYTVRDLIEAGRTRKDRRELAEKTELAERLILDWVLQAELLTLEGIGPAYIQLLKRAGIKSAPALSLLNPTELYKTLQKTNAKYQIVQRLPSLKDVRNWVRLAGRSHAGIRF